MSDGFPLVSIITVNFNQLKVTCELLDSIRKVNYPNLEVLLVDNGSKEDPTAVISKKYPEVKLIRSEENLGFSGGNNLAIVQSKGEYLFFLNNDTELPENCIEMLLKPFNEIEDLGAISPMILFHPDVRAGVSDIIQYAGATPVNSFTARNKTIGEGEKDRGQYNKCVLTPYVHGAAMMLKREVIEKVGMMPELFFLYYEELDWSEQIREKGFQIYIEPNARIFHKESASVGKSSAMKTYYLTRNRILFMRRNRSGLQLTLFSLFLVFITIPKNVLMHLLNGEWDLMNAFLKGLGWHFKTDKQQSFNSYSHINTRPVSASKANLNK